MLGWGWYRRGYLKEPGPRAQDEAPALGDAEEGGLGRRGAALGAPKISGAPNYPLRDPKYHLIDIIRPLIEVHWGGLVGAPNHMALIPREESTARALDKKSLCGGHGTLDFLFWYRFDFLQKLSLVAEYNLNFLTVDS